jgi:DNA-binding MarR family transcriptional regulator
MNRKMNQKSGAARRPADQRFTEKQGEYLAFIYTYSRMFRCSPAETDMQRHFQVSPPSVHQMVVTLERNGLIRRQPGVARSIELLVPPEQIPILKWLEIKQSNPL